MPRNKEPINLILAKGNKAHLTEDEIEKRRNEEVDVPLVTEIMPPKKLSLKQKTEFKAIAERLLAIGVFTELDVDCLARYVVAKTIYQKLTDKYMNSFKSFAIEDMKSIQLMQDRAFRQCRQSAADLGLTITSRAKLIVPSGDEDDEL